MLRILYRFMLSITATFFAVSMSENCQEISRLRIGRTYAHQVLDKPRLGHSWKPKGQAQELLSKVKWGGTFLTLNEEPLSLYSNASNPAEILEIEKGYLSEYSNQKVRSSTIV